MNKQILRLALPFIISNITVPLVGSVDAALMGNFGTTAHLGAIGLGGAIFNFLYWNFAFLRMSTVGLTAQEYGAGNDKEMANLLGRALLVSVIGALGLLIFQMPICKLAFKITKASSNIEDIATSYYYIRIWAAPATIGLSALTGWFIGVQNAKAPMVIAILVNLVNIGISYFLVAYSGLKSEGVAIGTVIGQYTGLFVALAILFVKYKSIISKIEIRTVLNVDGFVKFFKVNVDVFIRTLAIILVLTWYNVSSASKGELILAINVIFLQLVYAFSFFIDGFANAAEALVGKYVGARDGSVIKSVVKNLFYWGVGLALVFTLAYMFFWKNVMGIFTDDAAVIEGAAEYIIWIVAIPLVSVITFIWDGVFLGATATAEQRNTTIVAGLLFFIIYWFLEPKMGNHALLLAQLVFFGMRGLLQTFYFKPAILRKLVTTEDL